MNFEVIFLSQNLLLFWQGFISSLHILIWCLVVGGLLSLLLALARVSSIRPLNLTVWCFTYVVRGTPLLVQVYLIYYGVAQLEWIQAMWNSVWPWTMFKNPFFCLVFAFTLNTCAYTTEMLAGAIRETPAGEIEAARAAGFSHVQTMLHLVLPSALRRTLPAYSNEVIMMLHSTSLASVVPGLLDLTGAARAIYSKHFLPFEAFITAGVIYFCITFVLAFVLKKVEKRHLRYLRP